MNLSLCSLVDALPAHEAAGESATLPDCAPFFTQRSLKGGARAADLQGYGCLHDRLSSSLFSSSSLFPFSFSSRRSFSRLLGSCFVPFVLFRPPHTSASPLSGK